MPPLCTQGAVRGPRGHSGGPVLLEPGVQGVSPGGSVRGDGDQLLIPAANPAGATREGEEA